LKIFVAGPRAIVNLDKSVEERLFNIYKKKFTILVGDANGVDRAVQKYFSMLNYSNVIVFASEGKARNNIGNWQVEKVNVPQNTKGFDFYATKDKAMAERAKYGFMLWNGVSKGTLNNIVNLLNGSKKVLVYFTPKSQFICLDSFEKLQTLLNSCSDETKQLYGKLCKNPYLQELIQYTFSDSKVKI